MQKTIQFSQYQDLYDILIPKTHFLRRMHDEVDYSFIYEELQDKYCLDNGRMAIDPVRMFKYIILKHMTDLSDKDLIEEVNFNMAFKYFLDMAPEEKPIDSSTLCKFRTQRLKDKDLLDLLINKTLEMAVSNGVLKKAEDGKLHVSIIIDGTHTESLGNKRRPVPTLKEYSKRLRGQLYRCDEKLSGVIEDDHKISATDLKAEISYCYRLLNYIKEKLAKHLKVQSVSRVYNRLKELVDEINDHYNTSLYDKDARIGHKSPDTEFFGYKSQLAIDEETRLTLGANVTSGEASDTNAGKELLEELTSRPDISIDEVLGDTAYSSQSILELATDKKFKLIAPPHPILGTGIDGRDGFTFNKDADMFCCPMGHLAISKRNVTYKKDNNRKAVIYKFDTQKCKTCPIRDICMKGKKGEARTFSVTQLSEEQTDLLKRCKTDEFKDRLRERYKIEAKNAHLKQGYGYGKAKGKGIEMMELQAAVSIFVSNLKIIFAPKGEKTKK